MPSLPLITSPPLGMRSIAISVYVCVCMPVCSYIPKTLYPKFTKSSVHVACGRGSNLRCRQCSTLCSSGFMDDVMYLHQGAQAYTDLAHNHCGDCSSFRQHRQHCARTHARSTQPCIPPGSLNRVPASAGVRAGMSPLPGGR